MKKIAEGLPYRDFVTVGILVDKLLLKNKTKIHVVEAVVCFVVGTAISIALKKVH